MEHLKHEIHRLTDLLQVALSYGELGNEEKCTETLTNAVTVMTDLLGHLAKHGLHLLSRLPESPLPPTENDDEES